MYPQTTDHLHKRKTVLDAELRDLFAAAACMGLASEFTASTLTKGEADELAAASYQIADAMVRRRKANKDEFLRSRPHSMEQQPPRGQWTGGPEPRQVLNDAPQPRPPMFPGDLVT